MIRDFTLYSLRGEEIRISSFRGRANLLVVFSANSDAMHAFLEDAVKYSSQFSERETCVVAIFPKSSEENPIPKLMGSSIVVLFDKLLRAYRLSGATDESGYPIPLVYLTDRYGEIISTYAAPDHPMPPRIEGILSLLEFLNQQCPECDPPERPR